MSAQFNVNDDKKLRQLLLRCKHDFVYFAHNQLKIASKSAKTIPLKLNKAQLHIHDKLEAQLYEQGCVRALILKGRQQGASTYIEARYYWKVRFRKKVKAFILTHLLEATNNLFSMVSHYHDNLHPILRPQTESNNAKELKFKNIGSGYKVSTAESKATGRSSTIHYFHGSEVAFWPNAATHAAGVLQAVPEGHQTEVILESTANGVGGFFHEQWQKAERGEGDYIAIFVPWFWQEEYSRECPEDFRFTDNETHYIEQYGLSRDQAYWMHKKNIELRGNAGEIGWLFLQEYPFCAADAFQVSGEDKVVEPKHVVAARNFKVEKQGGAHVMGVDPSRFGDDRSSWIHRNRRCAFGLQSKAKTSTTELAGHIAREIDRYAAAGDPVDAVFIDVVGLGAGTVDALNDMGYQDIVIPVNAGGDALDKDEYRNKRAEMWGEMGLWFEEGQCSIPDSDSLHADLISPQYTYNLKQQMVLESKEQMRKRGIKSPDEGDALALTFAYPVSKKTNHVITHRSSNWRTL